ncbi:cobalamin biosynthesis protein [Nostoc sp. TCL26-01]|uniref:cobalamin biosynthesis protein n=1 Tax=Nostoc sp. TCL26-01 TaxID=2576904 RepID=UPI0015C104A0|nr:cobalamin biosynthesis protein [Nostoc sp. TCL26-01]QLE55056.1 cobalamin biosynthesis protein [Nostoc sp. TCL26-01]
MDKKTAQQPDLWIGVGCQLGISHQLLVAAIPEIFSVHQLDQEAIAGIATIDTKASELGLLEFCRLYSLPLKTFPAAILADVCVPNPSKVIAEKVGTSSVAEAAAMLAAADLSFSSNIFPQELRVKLLVPKTVFRLPGQLGVVTIAVAQTSSISTISRLGGGFA